MSLRRSIQALAVAVGVAAATPAAAWLSVLSGTADGNDVAEAAVLLPGGDVVVTGSLQSGDTHEDLLVARLDGRSGRPLWRVEMNGESAGGDPDFALDAGWDVAVDRRGDVFVGGTIQTPEGGPDATVLRLDGRSGRERWRTVMRVAGAEAFDLVHDVLVHPSGDVIAVVLANDEDFVTHFFAVRLDGVSGRQRWRQALAFASHQSTALDPAGNLVVAGLDYDYVADRHVTKVLEVAGDGGAVVWSRDLAGLVVASVAVGSGGEVVVGGREWGSDGSDGTVVRLDGATGAETWRIGVGGPDAGVDRVAVARDGAVLVAGTLAAGGGEQGVFVARHEPLAGALLWRTILDRGTPAPFGGAASALAFARWGDVIAVIAPVDNLASPLLVRLEASTGTERWRHATGQIVTAAVLTTRQDHVVAAGNTPWNAESGIDLAVFALDGRTGRDLGKVSPEPARAPSWMCGR